MTRVQTKLIVLLLAACSYAQGQHHHHESQQAKPAELLEGLGNHSHPIATESEVNDVHASEILRARVQLPANATNGLNDQKEFAFVRVIRGS